jgi:hypothetical protein
MTLRRRFCPSWSAAISTFCEVLVLAIWCATSGPPVGHAMTSMRRPSRAAASSLVVAT